MLFSLFIKLRLRIYFWPQYKIYSFINEYIKYRPYILFNTLWAFNIPRLIGAFYNLTFFNLTDVFVVLHLRKRFSIN